MGPLLGCTLIAIGILMVLYWGSGFGLDIWRQLSDEARRERLVATATAEGPPGSALARPVEGMDFKLVVPKLGYRAVVREGVGLDVLTSGPGHYPGTAWPGEAGVVGIAAHNVYWIRFDQLRAGDRVVVQTRYGAFDYRIREPCRAAGRHLGAASGAGPPADPDDLLAALGRRARRGAPRHLRRWRTNNVSSWIADKPSLNI